MRVYYSIVRCLFVGVLFIHFATRSDVADLVIIYDYFEGIVELKPGRGFTQYVIQDAFKSKAAPILLPGNLALRVAVLSQENIELFGYYDVPFRDQDFYKDVMRDAVETLKNITPGPENKDQRCVVNERLKKHYDLLVSDVLSNVSRYKAGSHSVDEITSILRTIKDIYSLMKQTQCEDLPAESSVASYAERFRSEICNGSNCLTHDWRMYSVMMPNGQPTPEHMVLFIPEGYAKAHNALDGFNINLEKLGFNQSALRLFTQTQLSLGKRSAGYDFSGGKVATSIKQIFSKTAPVSWNIIMLGHGTVSSGQETPITYMLKKPGYNHPIAGVSSKEFLALTDLWTTLPVNIVLYLTCRGGGRNIEAVRELLTIAMVVAKKAKASFNSPTIVSMTPNEFLGTYIKIDYKRFFDQLNRIYSDPKRTTAEQKELLQNALKEITRTSPVVVFAPTTENQQEVIKMDFLWGAPPSVRFESFVEQQQPEIQNQLKGLVKEMSDNVTFTSIVAVMMEGQISDDLIAQFLRQNLPAVMEEEIAFDKNAQQNYYRILETAMERSMEKTVAAFVDTADKDQKKTMLFKVLLRANQGNWTDVINSFLDNISTDEIKTMLKDLFQYAIFFNNARIIKFATENFSSSELRAILGDNLLNAIKNAIEKNATDIINFLFDGAGKNDVKLMLQMDMFGRALEFKNNTFINRVTEVLIGDELIDILGFGVCTALTGHIIEGDVVDVMAFLFSGKTKDQINAILTQLECSYLGIGNVEDMLQLAKKQGAAKIIKWLERDF